MNDKKLISVNITATTMFIVAAFILGGWLLYEAREIIPVILASLIFAAALEPGKRFLNQRFKLPIPLAVSTLYLLAFLVLGFLIYTLVPILINQYTLFIDSLPRMFDFLESLFGDTLVGPVLSSFFQNPEAITNTLKKSVDTGTTGLISVFNGIVEFILFLLLTFLFAVKPESVDNFFYVISPSKHRGYVLDLWNRTQVKMGQWFQGQLLLVVIIGVLTYFPLVLLDIPNALFLATFVGLMELIPIFGPVIGAIPVILMALTTGDLTTVLLVILLFILIQQLENNLIYPLVVTKVVGVPTIMVILAIVLGATLAILQSKELR